MKNFKFVKSKPITSYEAEVLQGIKKAVDEMKLIKAGKLKGIPAKESTSSQFTINPSRKISPTNC